MIVKQRQKYKYSPISDDEESQTLLKLVDHSDSENVDDDISHHHEHEERRPFIQMMMKKRCCL